MGRPKSPKSCEIKVRADTRQKLPQFGHEVVLGEVLRDLESRAKMGRDKYGTYLMSFNGRDSLWDAYQELLDLTMYIRQAILEGRDVKSEGYASFDTFQRSSRSTAIYPDVGSNVVYPALGLAGEVGELCEKIKKAYRQSGRLGNTLSAAQLRSVCRDGRCSLVCGEYC